MTAAKPGGRARVLNRAARERALIEAAAKLFATQGYETTTTREIASAAGCAEGLISRYFKGKAGLLRAMIQVHFDAEAEEFNDTSPPAKTVADEIEHRITWHVRHLREYRDFLSVLLPRLILDPDLGREVAELGPARHEKIVLERLAQHEEFRALPEEEKQVFAHMINMIGLTFGFLRPAMGEDGAPADRKAVTAARILSRAVYMSAAERGRIRRDSSKSSSSVSGE
jgi:AcrR family transcriptional regulator